MKRSDLMDMERAMTAEVVRRRQLGGYSQDAEGILLICETLMRLLQYNVDGCPPDKPTAKKPK